MIESLIGTLVVLLGGGQIVYAAPVEETQYSYITPVTIEDKIRAEFTDAPIMVEIARCESNFKNVKGQWSDDYGPFQLNWVHLEEMEELGLDRTNVDDNIKFARILYERKGTQPWYKSKDCWSK